jgi:hypothetical protein
MIVMTGEFFMAEKSYPQPDGIDNMTIVQWSREGASANVKKENVAATEGTARPGRRPL